MNGRGLDVGVEDGGADGDGVAMMMMGGWKARRWIRREG